MARLEFYLNTNQYRTGDNDKKPHYWSKVELPIEFLKAITSNAKDGDFSINAAAWVGENQKGNKYILFRMEDDEYQKKNGNQRAPERKESDPVEDTGVSGDTSNNGDDEIPF